MGIQKQEIQLYLEESYITEQNTLQKISNLSKDIENLQKKIVQTSQKEEHINIKSILVTLYCIETKLG